MKTHVSTDNNILFWRLNGEILKVEPWGPDGVRVRATSLSDFPVIPGALLESPTTPEVTVVVEDDIAVEVPEVHQPSISRAVCSAATSWSTSASVL